VDYISLGPRVPTLIISPYARPHYVDHEQMDFDSSLKFIEQDFGVPALTPRDRNDSSLLTSLDFKQRPAAPYPLTPGKCPKSDYHISTSVSGLLLNLTVHKYATAILVRISSANIATLLIDRTTTSEMANGQKAPLSVFQIGDRIQAQSTPDQQRALVYGAGAVRDLDVKPFGPQAGIISDTGQEGDTIVARFGRTNLLLNLSRSTRIYRLGGKRGSIADLIAGVTVRVTGIENTRLTELSRTDTVVVVQSPRIRKP
jgi:hypothetical protein